MVVSSTLKAGLEELIENGLGAGDIATRFRCLSPGEGLEGCLQSQHAG